MTNNIVVGEGLQDFVNKVIEVVRKGDSVEAYVRVAGRGLGPRTKAATFEIVTTVCPKVYICRGVSGMVSTISELVSQGRTIRSVTPISIYKANIEAGHYTALVRVKPETKYSQWDNFQTLLKEYRNNKPVEVETEEGIVEVDLKSLSKKELLEIVIEKGLKGNIQESKSKLIKRIQGEEG